MLPPRIRRRIANAKRQLLIVVLATTALPALANPTPPTVYFDGCALDKILFFSYTKDRQSAVEVCEVKEGYRYTFGKFAVVDIDEKSNRLTAEKVKLKLLPGGAEQVILKPGEMGSIHRDDVAGFALKRGNVFTWIESETNGNVCLVTADGGWDGWETAVNKKALALDASGTGFINEIDRLDMVPFTYDYSNVEYD